MINIILFSAGGAAGSVARITGSVGGALAALSFDQDYKRVCSELILLEYSIVIHKRAFR